ncbi:MAG: hypothetical protein ACK5LJ_05100 [Paracoccus sp. (in: a-proteobacteria)]
MMRYVVLDGPVIVQAGVCAPDVFPVIGGTLPAVEAPGGVGLGTHYWDADLGVFVEYPPRPGPWCEFDYSTDQWIDPRTMAEYEAYVQAKREAAKAPKTAILHQIADSSGLAYADIQDLATGRFPAVIVAALWQMTPLEITRAVIDWSAATEISRLDPVVLAVQAHMGTVDWNLDVLFGIALDPPPPAV